MELPIEMMTRPFSRTVFTAGGSRFAYDLEEHLILPAPPETIFDLRKDNTESLIVELSDLFTDNPFQIFHKEIVTSDKSGLFNKTSGETSKRGWTLFRGHALLDHIHYSGDGRVKIKLKDTERGSEEVVITQGIEPKFAFLYRRFPENINMENKAGLYLSTGRIGNPFSLRDESVYVLKDTE